MTDDDEILEAVDDLEAAPRKKRAWTRRQPPGTSKGHGGRRPGAGRKPSLSIKAAKDPSHHPESRKPPPGAPLPLLAAWGAQPSRFRMKQIAVRHGTVTQVDSQASIYREARRIARSVAPKMMRALIRMAEKAEDERVRSVCIIAALDRAGLRPIEDDPFPVTKAPFDPRAYNPEELKVIEQALKLIKERRVDTATPEIISPKNGIGQEPDDNQDDDS